METESLSMTWDICPARANDYLLHLLTLHDSLNLSMLLFSVIPADTVAWHVLISRQLRSSFSTVDANQNMSLTKIMYFCCNFIQYIYKLPVKTINVDIGGCIGRCGGPTNYTFNRSCLQPPFIYICCAVRWFIENETFFALLMIFDNVTGFYNN